MNLFSIVVSLNLFAHGPWQLAMVAVSRTFVFVMQIAGGRRRKAFAAAVCCGDEAANCLALCESRFCPSFCSPFPSMTKADGGPY